MCRAIRNPTADSKRSPVLRLGKKFNKSITQWLSLFTASGSLLRDCGVCPLGWRRPCSGRENKEPNVSHRREKPVISTQEDLLTWREMQRELCNRGFVRKCEDHWRLFGIRDELQLRTFDDSQENIMLWACFCKPNWFYSCEIWMICLKI